MSSVIHKPSEIIGDRYKIVNYIAEGGMQKVYYTEDIKLHRYVALKVPKNASATKRFKRSATLSAKVNHPYVAKTLDYFETEDNQYLVEEFIKGTDLRKGILDNCGYIDPYLCARIFHYLAKGVAASHHVGVIHRDLKPTNIMISGGCNLTEIKITDFGIAKMAEDELAVAAEGGEASITASKTMVGALPYMAPEMIDNPRETDTSSDIWSLGALLYELLSGEKPYGVGLKAVPKILDAKRPSTPKFIERCSIQFKTLGSQVFELACKCMKKDTSDRPSADQLVQSCEDLCYPINQRESGVVDSIRYRSWGFISGSNEQVFFNLDSVYGNRVSIGDKVSFSKFPGIPRWRAHPVLKLIE